MPGKPNRIIWLGQHEGERTKQAITAMQEALGQVRGVLGSAPLLSVRIADDFNTDGTPQFLRDRMGSLPPSATDRVHSLFRGGRPYMPQQEAHNGACLNRIWATGHSEIFLRPAHAYALSEGSTQDRSDAIRTLAHEYGHVHENGRGKSRLETLNRYNPSKMARAGSRAGAVAGMSEYYAVRAERTALHALNGDPATDPRVAGLAKDMAQVIGKAQTGSDMERFHKDPVYNHALGYLSGTLNAHLDADRELRGGDFARSSQGAMAAISEHLPPGSKGMIFLNQTRGSYSEMRRALQEGGGLQDAYMQVLGDHGKARDALALPEKVWARALASKVAARPILRRSVSRGMEIG